MHYLCKNHPNIMRPLILILLLSGIGTIIILIALSFTYKNELIDAHKEFFNYVVSGKTND